MQTVKQNYPMPLIAWAAGIHAVREGEKIVISGCNPGPSESSEVEILGYSRGQSDTQPPHVQLANATSDEKLIEFVAQYGPVFADGLEVAGERSFTVKGERRVELPDEPQNLIALQGLATLREERELMRTAIALIAELEKRDKANPFVAFLLGIRLSAALGTLQDQWERERKWLGERGLAGPFWRAQFLGAWPQITLPSLPPPADGEASAKQVRAGMEAALRTPAALRNLLVGDGAASFVDARVIGLFGAGGIVGLLQSSEVSRIAEEVLQKFSQQNPSAAGRLLPLLLGWAKSALCDLLNAFPPILSLSGGLPSETPPMPLLFGVRPALYFLLRRDYLAQGRIAICANARCGKAFATQRLGQRYCDLDCSQRQRARVYWGRSGKQKRAERRQAAGKKG